MSIDALKAQIKDHKLSNLYLFYGEEEYLKKYYLEGMEKQLLPDEGLKSLNRVVMEGKADQGRIIDCCETLPAFSERKLVIVKHSGLFKSKGKGTGEETKGKNKSEDLINYLQNLPEHVCLVFYEEEIDKRVKLVDVIKKKGLLVEFPLQKPAELVKWVMKAFSSYKKQMDPYTASRLVESSEQGMTELLGEINKLVMYSGDRTSITQEDVERVCVKSIKTRIFDLMDAIAEKDKGRALKLLDDMIAMKEPLQKITFMITKHFRQLLEMKLLLKEGMDSGAAAAKIGITPYAAAKIYKQCKGFTVERLKASIEESLEIDIAVKTGRLKDRLAAEILITCLAS